MIDIFSARQAYGRREIDNVGLAAGTYDLTDDFTHFDGNGELFEAMETNMLDHPVRDYFRI